MKKKIIILFAIIGFAYNCNKDEQFSECYSPYQNLEAAYLAGAIGCSCTDNVDNDTCVKDNNGKLVALICREGEWIAVEDGPCMPAFNK